MAKLTSLGSPLEFPPDTKSIEVCTPEEITTCSILRIFPAQYLHIKETMMRQVLKGPFKKRDAQTWFRIDVNKTNRLYDWFLYLGWIPGQEGPWLLIQVPTDFVRMVGTRPRVFG